MIGKLGQFYVECGLHGARVMSTRLDLTPNCLGNEIDEHIQLIKDDLDACAREMKRRVRGLNARGPFERAERNT